MNYWLVLDLGAIVMKLKVLIADDEPLICSMLAKVIRTEELDLEIVGIAYDGEKLFSMLCETQADIVIIDICMPKLDGLQVIQRAAEQKLPAKFLIISGYRQFDYAYNALKYDVDDYILKPIDTEELNNALLKISNSIRKNRESIPPHENNAASRRYFFIKVINEPELQNLTLDDCNTNYGTAFQPGLFLCIFFKLDYVTDARMLFESFTSLRKKLQDLILSRFSSLCYDILNETKSDGIITLFNYSASNSSAIDQELNSFLRYGQRIIELFEGLHLTVCVGRPYSELSKIDVSKKEARSAEWMRMALGINKVIRYQESPYSMDLNEKFCEFNKRLDSTYETLNISEFKACVENIFSLPYSVLYQPETRSWILQICDCFFDRNSELISLFANEDSLRKETHSVLRCSTTFEQYKTNFLSLFGHIFEQMIQTVNSRSTKPVRQAITYIEDNYSQPLNLEVVAAKVNLNPVYFSNIFKKETGQNFTEYVTARRMDKARELLRKSELNINEIAAFLGYSDARYFSKLFKKNIGIKPTEYRKIFG